MRGVWTRRRGCLVLAALVGGGACGDLAKDSPLADARRYHLSEYGGRELELVGVDPRGETEEYPDFVLHRGARMTVRDVRSGDEGVIPLMDVLVEMGGGWKFLNFEDDL